MAIAQKCKKKILFVLLILSCVYNEPTHAQTFIGDQDDHEVLQKYWYYRWRLKNDFMVMGDQPGESLPFSERNFYEEGSIGVGDATQLLGFYISTLTTEHNLLAETNRIYDLPATRTELYYAYKAYERLDLAAEPYYPYVFSRTDLQSNVAPSLPIVEKKIQKLLLPFP